MVLQVLYKATLKLLHFTVSPGTQEEYKKASHDHAQRGLYWGYGIVAVVSEANCDRVLGQYREAACKVD